MKLAIATVFAAASAEKKVKNISFNTITISAKLFIFILRSKNFNLGGFDE